MRPLFMTCTSIFGHASRKSSKVADRVFHFEKWPDSMPKLSAKTWLKMKDQKTLDTFSLTSGVIGSSPTCH
jgi:hypothetical protein